MKEPVGKVARGGRRLAIQSAAAPMSKAVSEVSLTQARKDLETRLARLRLPRSVATFSRAECYD